MQISQPPREDLSVPAPRQANEDVRRCVEHQEWLERVVPRIAFWTVFGSAILMLLDRYGWRVTGGVLVGSMVALVVARLAVAVVVHFGLQPCRNIRFRRARRKLAAMLKDAAELTSMPCSWYTGAPGAFALTKAGELLLVDRSSGYELLRLTPDWIAAVSVERDLTLVTQTRHSGRSVVGGVGGGFFGGWASGGRSRSVSRHIEETYLEIRYQLEPNGLVRVAVAPFGSGRRGADAACAMIARLQR
jgi:hypothetical protein